MSHHVKLWSEKYVSESVKKEVASIRRQQRKSFVRDLASLFLSAASFGVAVAAVFYYPDWVEVAQSWF